jgi:GntR family transcriptional regulator
MAAEPQGYDRRSPMPARRTGPLAAAAEAARFVPRYYEIEQALRTRIAGLRPDDPLPSDAQLCAEFGVSRMTARNAVARLAQEGLVYRVPGRGTFVAEPPLHRQAGNLLSFTEEMRRRGRRPHSRVLSREVREPSEQERGRLRLGAGAQVFALTRLRIADEEPMAVEVAVFPADLAEPLLRADLEERSLHTTLVELGRIPTVGRASLGAEAASAEDARLLAIDPGAPMLVERRLIYSQDGDPLELTESRYAGARYGLDVAFDVDVARAAPG